MNPFEKILAEEDNSPIEPLTDEEKKMLFHGLDETVKLLADNPTVRDLAVSTRFKLKRILN